ncbi:hypothetical protein BHE74_00052561 [Ensete ventricosum]|nr:hypothetical protein BHE74_00052561 [Ensete ventricosum]
MHDCRRRETAAHGCFTSFASLSREQQEKQLRCSQSLHLREQLLLCWAYFAYTLSSFSLHGTSVGAILRSEEPPGPAPWRHQHCQRAAGKRPRVSPPPPPEARGEATSLPGESINGVGGGPLPYPAFDTLFLLPRGRYRRCTAADTLQGAGVDDKQETGYNGRLPPLATDAIPAASSSAAVLLLLLHGDGGRRQPASESAACGR